MDTSVPWRKYSDVVEQFDEDADHHDPPEDHRECVDKLKVVVREVLRTTLHIKSLESSTSSGDAKAALKLIQRTLRGQTCLFGNHIFVKKTACIVLLNLLKLLPEPKCEDVAEDLIDTAADLAIQLGYQDFSMLHCFLRDCTDALELACDRPFKVNVFPSFVQRCKAASEETPRGLATGSTATATPGPSEKLCPPPPGVSLQLGSPNRMTAFCTRLTRLSTLVVLRIGSFSSSSDLEALQVALLGLAANTSSRWQPEVSVPSDCDPMRIACACLRSCHSILKEAVQVGTFGRTSLHVELCTLEAISIVATPLLTRCAEEGVSVVLGLIRHAIANFDAKLIFPRLKDILSPLWPQSSAPPSGGAPGLSALTAAATRFGGIGMSSLAVSSETLVESVAKGFCNSALVAISPRDRTEMVSALRRLGLVSGFSTHAAGFCRQMRARRAQQGELETDVAAICALSIAVRAGPEVSRSALIDVGGARQSYADPARDAVGLFVEEAKVLLRRGAPAAEGKQATALEMVLATMQEQPWCMSMLEGESAEFLSALATAVAVVKPVPAVWRLFLSALRVFLETSPAPLDAKLLLLHGIFARCGAGRVDTAHAMAAGWVAIGHALVLHVERRLDGLLNTAADADFPSFTKLMELANDALKTFPPLRPVIAAVSYAFPVLVTFAYTIPALRDVGEQTRMPRMSQLFAPTSPYSSPDVLVQLGLPLQSPPNTIYASTTLVQPGVKLARRETENAELVSGNLRQVCLPTGCCFCGSPVQQNSSNDEESFGSAACSKCGMEIPMLNWYIFEISRGGSDTRLRLPSVWQALRQRQGDLGVSVSSGRTKACWLRNIKDLCDLYGRISKALLDNSAQGYLSLLEPTDSQDSSAARCVPSDKRPPNRDIQWVLECGLLGLCVSSASSQLQEHSQAITGFFQALCPQGQGQLEEFALRRGCVPNLVMGLVQSWTFAGALLKVSGQKDNEITTPTRNSQRAALVRQHRFLVRCHQWRLEVLGASGSPPWIDSSDGRRCSQDVDVSPAPPRAVVPLLSPAAFRAVLLGGVRNGAMSAAVASLLASTVAGKSVGAGTRCLQHLFAFSTLAPQRLDDLFRTLRGDLYHRLFENYSRGNARVNGLCQLFLRGVVKGQVRTLLPKILPAMVLNSRMETIQELCALLEESVESLFTPQLPYILSAVAEQPVQKVTSAFVFILDRIFHKKMTISNICEAFLGKVLVLILWRSAALEGDREAFKRAQAAITNIGSALRTQGGDVVGAKAHGKRPVAGGVGSSSKRRFGPGGEVLDVGIESSPEVSETLEGSFLHVLDIYGIVFTGNRQSPKWAEYYPLLCDDPHGGDSIDHRRVLVAIALLFELMQENLHSYAPKVLEFMQSATQLSNYHENCARCWQHYVKFVGVARLKPLLPAVVGELLRLASRLRPTGTDVSRHLCENLLCDLVEATCRQHEDLVPYLPDLPMWSELKAPRNAVQKALAAQESADFAKKIEVALVQLESASQQAVRRAALNHIDDLVASLKRGNPPKCGGVSSLLSKALIAKLMQALFKFLWESSAWPSDQLKCGELLGRIGALDPINFVSLDTARGQVTKMPQDLGNREMLAKRVLVDFLAPNLTSKNSYAFSVQEILKHLQANNMADRLLASLKDDVRETLKPYLHSSYQLIESDDQVQTSGSARTIAQRLGDTTTFEGVVAQAVGLARGGDASLFEACLPAVQGNHALALFLMHHVLNELLTSTSGSPSLQDLTALSTSLAGLLTSPKHETAQAVFSLVDDMTQRKDHVQLEVTVTRSADSRCRDRMMQRIEHLRKPITNRKIVAASVRCGAHARALQFLEEAILEEHTGSSFYHFDVPSLNKEEDCFLLQSIYRDLDEPDGVLGALRIGPSTVKMRALQLEQAARWHDAQACYEEQLSSTNVSSSQRQDLICGLINCNQNMRRYECALRLIQGTSDDEGCRARLRPAAVEAAWQLSSWDRLHQALDMPKVDTDDSDDFQLCLGKSLLAFHTGESDVLKTQISEATLQVTRAVASAARESYARAYQHLLKLHVLSDLAWLARSKEENSATTPGTFAQAVLERANAAAPTYVVRQMVLSPVRVALLEMGMVEDAKQVELEFIRLSRKFSVQFVMEHPSTSFIRASSSLQVRAQMEWGKLLYARGFRDDALQHMTQLGMHHARAKLLGTRWATEAESELLIPKVAEAEYEDVKERMPDREAAWFYHAAYLDQLLKEQIAAKVAGPSPKVPRRGAGSVCPFDVQKLIVFTLRGYFQALQRGNKRMHFILNRVLQVAWDCCELDVHRADVVNEIRAQAATMQPWMWYIVLPQLVSRVNNVHMRPLFSDLIKTVLTTYPYQAFWHFIQLIKSTKEGRQSFSMTLMQDVARKDRVLHRIFSPNYMVMQDFIQLAMANPPDGSYQMSLSRTYPKLVGSVGGAPRANDKWKVVVPLQSQMTAAIPRMSSPSETKASIDAFPNMIFSERCADQVDVFKTKERPKKLVFLGSDGREYPFLCKAERRGDLRKDSRMMMFGNMVNQLLDENPDARRRNLNLTTFNVVILQESCGLIEWVSQTRGMRHVIDDLWKRLRPGHQQTVREIKDMFDHSKDLYETFTKQVLPRHPPVLHRWFTQATDPSVWLAKRSTFARTQAVWCMLGYIVGLGDRHGENILMHTESGRTVHVDFDCLFGKGMLLERPESVPFRLTQNFVAALGITGIEGVFRRSCELCMGVMRERSNKQTLLSVLNVYIADPLIEWTARQQKDPKLDEEFGIQVARSTLGDVEKKLNGMLNVGAVVRLNNRRESESVLTPAERGRGLLGRDRGVGLSVAGQVDELLKAAMCKRNLSEMYVGWQPWV